MKRRIIILMTGLLIFPLTLGAIGAGLDNVKPKFDEEGSLIMPDPGDWPLVSVSFRLRKEFRPDDVDFPPEKSGEFIIIKTQPNSIAAFLETGEFPEGTIFTMDFHFANRIDAETKYFAHQQSGTRVSVKDSERFESKWGFYQFRKGQETASLLPAEQCLDCHMARASETDLAFTEFYTIFNSD